MKHLNSGPLCLKVRFHYSGRSNAYQWGHVSKTRTARSTGASLCSPVDRDSFSLAGLDSERRFDEDGTRLPVPNLQRGFVCSERQVL